MPAALAAILGLLSGFGLGVVFYGGLWITVRRLPTARHPAVLALGSFWGRTALVAGGFIVAISHSLLSAIACFLGFILARILLTRWLPEHGGTRQEIV